MKRLPFAAIGLLLILATGLPPPSPAQDEPDMAALAGGNIERTSNDDLPDEGTRSTQLGSLGAVTIPISLDMDCHATIALYTPAGRLVRILGQVLDLKKGAYEVRWDGLDLFGNVVPMGRELVAKTIYNKPVSAFYEFAVSAPMVSPWGGAYGEGTDRRAGGWLGDHSAPGCAVAVGNVVLLGCSVAEHGDNLIAVNLRGEKLWGHKLDGWSGPRELVTDGTHVYAIGRQGSKIYKIEPVLKTDERGRHRLPKELLVDTGREKIQCVAVNGGKLYAVLRSLAAAINPFRAATGNGGIDFLRSRPQVLSTSAPTEFHISPQAAFGNTFTTAGNPQNGAGMVLKDGDGYVLAVFKEPAEIGTVVLGRMTSAAAGQVFVLKPGLKYAEKMSPIESGSDDELGGLLDIAEFDEYWDLLGETDMRSPLSFLPTKKAPVTTQAMYIKCTPKNRQDKSWRPRLGMARVMKERFAAVPIRARVAYNGAIEMYGVSPDSRAPSWNPRTKYPVSDIYPFTVVLDLGRNESFDGVVLLNCVNPTIHIYALSGDAAAAEGAPEEAWTRVGRFDGAYDKKLRYLTAGKHANEQYVVFDERITTRALRFRVMTGYRSGKWGQSKDDPFRVETDAVALVRLLRERTKAPSHTLRIYSAEDGKELGSWSADECDMAKIAFGADGTLYSVSRGRLCRTAIDENSGRISHRPLGEDVFENAVSLATSGDRIGVGDSGQNSILLYDPAGVRRGVIGGRGPRKRGPWDPRVVHKPSGITFDPDGNIWVAEASFAPKRVAKYAPDGRCLAEFLGPPMYGGGGHLDPNLRALYYRSMEFELDWEKGASVLKNLNDRLFSEETPVQVQNSFTYTAIGRPVYHSGRRYLVQGATIVMAEGDTWHPCMVAGNANNSYFLLGKECWKRHWARLDLTEKQFIWCDKNEDGRYQVEEVELFPSMGRHAFGGGLAVGPGLSFWGGIRWKPYTITPGGVPLFRRYDIEPFNYGALAPHYAKNYTLSGPRSAKPSYSGFKRVLSDGSLVQEGQPYIVKADGTILGGSPDTRPTDYIPPVHGLVMNTPWGFAGGAMTSSEVGEIAIVNSMRGYWYVWGANYGVVIGKFFTGETGGWRGSPPERGHDVTGKKQDWEGWHGDFVKAHDGNYYAQAGKGFHGISRVEGLDGFRIKSQVVRISREEHAANQALRSVLKARHRAASMRSSGSGALSVTVPRRQTRVPHFKLDGFVDEWGDRKTWASMGPTEHKLFLDLAHDESGVYVAYSGESGLRNDGRDWREAFRTGFCLDVKWRMRAQDTSGRPFDSNRRVVVAKHGGEWTAVLYDYNAPDAAADEAVEFASAVGVTKIERVRRLPGDAFGFAIREDALGIDAVSLTDLDDVGDGPELPGDAPRKAAKPAAKDLQLWTAELFLPWETLGAAPGSRLRCDFGVFDADESGRKTGSRRYWSNPEPAPISDPAIETMLNPGAWGTAWFR